MSRNTETAGPCSLIKIGVNLYADIATPMFLFGHVSFLPHLPDKTNVREMGGRKN